MSRSEKDRSSRYDDDYRDIRPHGSLKRRENKSRRHNDRQRLRDFIGYNGPSINDRKKENHDEDND